MPETLYQRLGGAERIAAILEESIDRHAVNPLLAPRLRGKDLPRLKELGMQFLRAGMDLSEQELLAAIDDVVATLNAQGGNPFLFQGDSMSKSATAAAFAAVLVLAAPAAQSMGDDVFVNPRDIQWGAAPPVLPKGAQIAVLHGDPFKPGAYTLRLALPANYRIAPHWHSQVENVTVISGALYLGMGDTMNEKAGRALKAGGYHYLPAKVHHYAFSRNPTVIQISGEGPFDINYLDPKDSPMPQ